MSFGIPLITLKYWESLFNGDIGLYMEVGLCTYFAKA